MGRSYKRLHATVTEQQRIVFVVGFKVPDTPFNQACEIQRVEGI